MNKYKTTPYLLTIIVFDIIYWVTMLIPNHDLYLGFGNDWREVIKNNKLPLHREIFTYGLALVIAGINLLEIVKTKNDKFLSRLIKSTATILLTYLGAGFIYKFLEVNTWNLFYYNRGNPAFGLMLLTILHTFGGLIVLEFLKRINLIKIISFHYYS